MINKYTPKEISSIKHRWLQALALYFGCSCISKIFNAVTKLVGNYSDIQTWGIVAIAFILMFFSYGLTYFYGCKKPWKSFLLVNAFSRCILLIRDMVLKMYEISTMVMQGLRFEILIFIILTTGCFFVVKVYYYYMSYKLYRVYKYLESQE